MGKKIHLLAKKSNLLDIRIKVGSELVRFNLFEELAINPTKINEELQNQPTHFAYLSVVMIQLKKKKDTLEAELQKLKDSIFIEYKEDIDPQTGRAYSNDLAEAYISQDEEYQEKLKEYKTAEDNYLLIKAAVDSFSQRSEVIRSLSANVRQEKSIN